MPSLQSVTFDTSGLRFDREETARKIWVTSDGDGISLNFFSKQPDIPPALRSLQDLRNFYLSALKKSEAKLIEVDTTIVGACPAVRLILKAPQQPSGLTYVGSFIIPFRDFSYVVKVQCQEQGMSGIREAILFDRKRREGTITLDASGKITGNWNPDAEEHDAQFPTHPLTRLRRLLKQIETSLAIEPATQSQPKFPLP